MESSTRTSIALASLAAASLLLLPACGGDGQEEPAPPSAPEPPASEEASSGDESAAAAPEPAADPRPVADTVPEGAPTLPGFDFPSYGTLREGAHAYFPTQPTAEKLMAGAVDESGTSWFRGTVVSVNAEEGVATVRDAQDEEYSVALSYVVQAAEPVESVEVGRVYVGNRFNRPELVMVTAGLDEHGEVTTVRLGGRRPGREREDELEHLVEVEPGSPGSNAICHGPDGTRRYTVLRHAGGEVLGWNGIHVRVLDAAACAFPPLRPELAQGDTVHYADRIRVREGTVVSVDSAIGAVTVREEDDDEDTTYFGLVVRELPPEPEG